ncbi:TetR/AcrR family transcriptional regulator [Paraburkholderia azotifigens]|uniref:TetR/AcrR family transcriptional regulator n=1 Tax=Paraburkholderia azotifigens TaxID=2057004 RepID=A0A5C6V8N3_9BURK|nr:TetR/AcrR family transcriptional regulator [Paraburkholderia azotifigens]TXC81094.1 TetR/AcrR family transcriptional regulator [Paraburkholderia azotifigens]
MLSPREFNKFDVIDAAFSYFGEDNFLDASMRKLAHCADMSCGSLYNAFADKRSLFRSTLVHSVERSFGRAIVAEPAQLSPFSKIELFFAQAVDTYVHPARSDARLLHTVGFEAESFDTDCSAIVSQTIKPIESCLTERVYAGRLQEEIIRTQPSTELGSPLLTTLLSMRIFCRLRAQRRHLEKRLSDASPIEESEDQLTLQTQTVSLHATLQAGKRREQASSRHKQKPEFFVLQQA